MSHVLKHVPSTGRDAEGGKIPQINALLRTASKNVHGIIDKRRRMALSRYWYVANTV
jgi:hypothetical protein